VTARRRPTDYRAAVRAAQNGVLLTEMASIRGSRARATARRARVASLPEAARLELIDTFVQLIEGLYAHLPLKRAMYATDPVQRLRLLAQRAALVDDLAFHYELARIVTGLRDAHTRYVGPDSLADQVAMLPFLVESYGTPPGAGYIVSKVASTRSLVGDAHFVPGVELLWWNAVPIDRAVDLYAEYETGGRPDSRRARALETLTLRSLQYEPPPDEQWVVVGYRDLDGKEREVRILWRVVEPGRAALSGAEGRRAAAASRRQGVDPAREAARRVKKLLFAPRQWFADQASRGPRAAARSGSASTTRVKVGEWIDTEFADTVSAKLVDTRSGQFGYLRLWSFDVADDEPFVDEVVRLLGLLGAGGENGVILDLRANPGGLIWAAERLLQLFTPNVIAPTRFSFLATPLSKAMAEAPQNEQELEPWLASLQDAVATGEPYSQSVPITPEERCNDRGQVYGGPVVAVVDANTYSAGDLFAAGFYDNEVGILVTVGEATGAGGANVWWSDQVADAVAGTAFERPALPKGIGYSMAARRATRGAGAAAGTAIEDVGVRGHRTYAMTKADLTGSNEDLLAFCGKILAGLPSTALRVAPAAGNAPEITVSTRALDRLDLFADERPAGSRDVTDGDTVLEVPVPWAVLEVRGYARQTLRQRRRVTV
jgi:hypothetical protein